MREAKKIKMGKLYGKDVEVKLKKGETLHFPVMLPFERFSNSPWKEMLKISKKYKIPLEKLRYKREIFYLKGWEDGAEISYTK